MTLTPAIVNSTLALKTTFTVGNTGNRHPDLVAISDLSNWSSIVSSSTDKVNIILEILDPAGQIVYQNPNWAAQTFGSPDLYYGTSPITTTLSSILLYDANGNLITGTFTVNAQVQVVQNWATTPVYTLATSTSQPLLNYQYLQINIMPAITFTPNYPYANMTVSDSSNYGVYSSITRSITVTPPVQSGQSPFTSASNSVLVTNLWSPSPYQAELQNIVYYNVTSLTETISYIFYFQNFETANNTSFCELYCCLKDLYSKMNYYRDRNQSEYAQLQNRYNAGCDIYTLCELALACSDTEAIPAYVQQFYQVTGCTVGCGCGCSDTPSPVIPVVPTQGPAGANGVSVVSAFIVAGDLILTLSNSTTINAGAVPSGTNGSNGIGLIWPPFINSGGTNITSYTSTIPANTFTSVGDSIRMLVDVLVPAIGTGQIRMTLAGTLITIPIDAISINTQYGIAELLIEYTGSNTVKLGVSEEYYTAATVFGTINAGLLEAKYIFSTQTLSFNPTINNTFVLSATAAPFSVQVIEAVIEKIGVSTPTFTSIYTTGNNTTNYQNNALIGLVANSIAVYVDGLICFPSVRYTFDSSTGSITWIGGSVLSTQSLAIIPA